VEASGPGLKDNFILTMGCWNEHKFDLIGENMYKKSISIRLSLIIK
jgi:hypothetical protein